MSAREMPSDSPIGDVTIPEDAASVDQVKAVYDELKRQMV